MAGAVSRRLRRGISVKRRVLNISAPGPEPCADDLMRIAFAGDPVGFGAAFYQALAALTGDEGAKTIIAAHRDRMIRIDVEDPGILRDIDKREDLA